MDNQVNPTYYLTCHRAGPPRIVTFEVQGHDSVMIHHNVLVDGEWFVYPSGSFPRAEYKIGYEYTKDCMRDLWRAMKKDGWK